MRRIETLIKKREELSKLLESINTQIAEYYSTHWRDDDSPKGEFAASESPAQLFQVT